MLVKIFVLISILLFFALLSGKIYFYKHTNRFIREKSVTIGTVLMFFYILLSFILVFQIPMTQKPVIFLCGISPFIIGHFATYKKLSFYTVLQLSAILLSIIIVNI